MEQRKKIIFLGILGIVLAGILVYTFSQTNVEKNKDKQNEKTETPEIIVKNFYDWYKKQDGSVLENTKMIVEKAKENGFITPEFATTTIQHPLITSKKADVFLCTSKKSNTVIPTIFAITSSSTSTGITSIKGWTSIPEHTINISFNEKQNKISGIFCPMIPNIE